MTQNEKAVYWEALATLADLIDRTPHPVPKTQEHLAAFGTALLAMYSQKASRRSIMIFLYHVETPDAHLFRDAYTIAALREAHKCVMQVIEKEGVKRYAK